MLLKTLSTGEREAEFTFLKQQYNLPGKAMDLPLLQCFKYSLEKQVRNGFGPSDLSLRKGDGLEDPSIPYDLMNLC